MKYTLTLFALSILMFSCVPPQRDAITEINLDYTNPTIQKLYDFQDQRNVDSLLKYIVQDNDTYQYLCARAFTAIQDDRAKPALIKLLKDSNEKVAKAAIYALSQFQTGDIVPHLQKAYDPYDSLLVRGEINGALLSAIGKCGDLTDLKNLTSISNFTKYDTVLINGQLESIYRFNLRKINSKDGSAVMSKALLNKDLSSKTKFWAASYFQRKSTMDSVMIWPLKDYLMIYDGLDFATKKAFILGVGKTGHKTALQFLKKTYKEATNPNIKISLINAFKSFTYPEVSNEIWQSLDSSDESVALAGTEFFMSNGNGADANLYWKKAKKANIGKDVSLNLYNASLKYMPVSFVKSVKAIVWELKKMYRLNENNPTTQAKILNNLAQMPWQYNNIAKMGDASKSTIVKTGAVTALGTIAKRPDFEAYFGPSSKGIKRILAQKFYEVIQFGDVGMISEAATVLADKNLGFKEVADSITILENALKIIKLPREIEGYNSLVSAINTLKDTVLYQKKTPDFNHQINWNLIEPITEETRARIHTSKGIVEIKFFPKSAPGSVANFIHLVNAGFYKNKSFHRVIPNFVAQGGCPRGDGYGSLDYSIRSEFGQPFYDDHGMVGMASAGLDTEGTQWFITHCKMPHLDGRYTIFAKVTEGMDVVNKIAVGDRIDKIALLKI